jgi:hypothetical protein
MSFSELLAHLNELGGNEAQPAAFQTRDNFSDQGTLYTIGLD